MIVLLDNGHGILTKGKMSPDRSLKEWIWTREVAALVQKSLASEGYDARLLVPESEDISLTNRASRANYYCSKYGTSNVILISVHVNAAGDGSRWMNARGWSAYTSKGQTKGDRLADCLYDAAEKEFKEFKIRKDLSDGDRDWEENFTILTKTKCAASLVENFFMDNPLDCDFLKSEAGKMRCASVIVAGTKKYIEQYG